MSLWIAREHGHHSSLRPWLKPPVLGRKKKKNRERRREREREIELWIMLFFLLYKHHHNHYSIYKMHIFLHYNTLFQSFFFFSFISVLTYAVCYENRKRCKKQIHLFKFILSTDHELLRYYIMSIVKIIPVTLHMSIQLFFYGKMNSYKQWLKYIHIKKYCIKLHKYILCIYTP